jgi:hypothetical protein
VTESIRNLPRYIRQTDAFGWQGADSADGPWRSITPPQSGTPWQTTNPMNDLRQASAEVSGVAVLSPAALNVWDRFCGIVEDHGPPRLALAAALRALANELVPVADDPEFFVGNCCERNVAQEREDIRTELLAIAAELEGQ